MITPDQERWRHLWAKSEPYHCLWRHLLDAFAVCEALIPCVGGVDGLDDRTTAFFVALHDLGKADGEFQGKHEELGAGLRALDFAIPAMNPLFRHEVRSARWVEKWLMKEHGWPEETATIVRQAIVGHHGDFKAKLRQMEIGGRSTEYDQLRDALAAMICRTTGVSSIPPPDFDNASVSGMKLVALTVMSDWIVSNPDTYHYPALKDTDDPVEYLERARLQAKNVVCRLGFRRPDPDARQSATVRFCDLFPGYEPRPLQRMIEEHLVAGDIPPGLVIIEDRMGQGKTEAALHIAEEWRRLGVSAGAYIGLPTEATSNQMHQRYEEFLGRRGGDAPRLIHGRSWLVEDELELRRLELWGSDRKEEDLARLWFRSTRRALLAAEGVGTVDQAMSATLNVRFGFLRLLGLSRKTLIIDEVHAYDAYMLTIIRRLLEWCHALEIPVLLLSATLARGQKEDLARAYGGVELPVQEGDEPYPLATVAPLDGPVRLIHSPTPPAEEVALSICPHRGLLEDYNGAAGLAMDLTRSGGCCCVLANTVKAAQNIFRRLLDLHACGKLDPRCKLLLYHARFTAKQRAEIEQEVIGSFGKRAGTDGKFARPERAILVATQVVEQSLDVDFDVMISQIAPIDLLLQRAGRLHRHERGPRPTGPVPELHVLLPDRNEPELFGASKYVYRALEPLVRTMPLVDAPCVIRLPADFRRLIRAVYGEDASDLPDLPDEVLKKAGETASKLKLQAEHKAQGCLLAPPAAEAFEMADPARDEAAQEQDENARRKWFRASTRQTQTGRAYLAIEKDSEEAGWIRSQQRPFMNRFKSLMLLQVSLPDWWGVEAEECAADWLRGRPVLWMIDGRANSKRGEIVQDPVRGFLLENEDEMEESE